MVGRLQRNVSEYCKGCRDVEYIPWGTLRRHQGRWQSNNAKALRNIIINDAIVLLRFLREAKEAKEHDSTERGDPARQLHGHNQQMVASPEDARDLLDAGEGEVSVGPASPGPDDG